MTTLEIILIIILWLALGFFICHKARWFTDESKYTDDGIMESTFVIFFAPIAFVYNVINLVFVKPWINDD